MLRSMYSGISGMKANQTKLDVIGNNIANVGTTGFKSSTARFQDMLSQSVKDSMAPNANQGGVNSAQVGLGVKLASIDSVMKQGNLQPTGRALDMAIDGDGFFMVSKGAAVFGDNQLEVNQKSGAHNITAQSLTNSGAQLMYTRDGAFSLDEQGNLITADGYRVMGYALTNDDTSVPPTFKNSNSVDLDGFNFKFGPGSALNGYKVSLGKIGPQTVTSANIDTTKKQIIIDGDFATEGALTSAQVESAINKALSSVGISQSVFVAGKPDNFSNLISDRSSGGLDNTAPANVIACGFTFKFSEGNQLEKYTIKFDKVGPDNTKPTARVQKDAPQTIFVNADLSNQNLSGEDIANAINDTLKHEGITQTVGVTGSVASVPQIGDQVDATGTFAQKPNLLDKDTKLPISTIGGLTFNFTKGSALNSYKIKFGDTTANANLSVTVDKSNTTITINGDPSKYTLPQLASAINTELNKNSITNPQIDTTLGITGTFNSSDRMVGFIDNGKGDVKPADIQIGGFNFSFPIGDKYNNMKFKLVEVSADQTDVKYDSSTNTVNIYGDFLGNSGVSSSDLQSKLKAALTTGTTPFISPATDFDDKYKITVSGVSKSYTNMVSDIISGGTSAVSPDFGKQSVLGLTFKASPGSPLNGYSIQIGNIMQDRVTADIDEANKKIIINGDFVTPSATSDTIASAINRAINSHQLGNQRVTVEGSLIPIRASQALSTVTNGGTPVESLDSNGDVTYVDGTKVLKAYDGALKTLRIPEKVKIPGTDTELRIKSYTIDKNGIISGVLEDGKVAALGQVAMAAFKNASGLTKQGGNLYSQSVNSGEATIKSGSNTRDDDNSKGFGDALQGMLEMSNVDLAEQFTDMITATRAFQASSKMINTGDEILQDIINLKR